MGCPGPLDLNKGVVLEAPNLGWRNVELKEMFGKKFKCPVAIANDVDAGTYGEYRFGAGQKARCVLGVFPGTGIGGGCVYEGKLVRGRTGSCMEIGHMYWCSPTDGCAAAGAAAAWKPWPAAWPSPRNVRDRGLFRGEAPILLKLAGTDLANIRSGTLAEAIQKGDKVVEKIVRNAAKQIGTAIGSVVNLLAPDVVVLGGGLVEAMKSLMLEEVRDAFAKRAMSSYVKSTEIVAAKLDDNATALGAAALASEAAKPEAHLHQRLMRRDPNN
jgi:glucokinase